MDIVQMDDGSFWLSETVVVETVVDQDEFTQRCIFESPGYSEGLPGAFAIYRDYATGKMFEEVLTGDPDFPAFLKEVAE